MIHLCAGDLHASDFMDLLSGQSWPKDTLFMGFSAAQARFDRLAVMDTTFVSQTDQGRIFAASGELRWRCLDGIVRSVYTGAFTSGKIPLLVYPTARTDCMA